MHDLSQEISVCWLNSSYFKKRCSFEPDDLSLRVSLEIRVNTGLLAPLALIIGSVVLYQVSTKLLPKGLNHWHALMIFYALALLTTLLLSLTDRSARSPFEALAKLNWAVPLVAVSIIGIELGWILVFRAGAGLSLTGLIVNVAVAVIVIPIGLLFFKEQISLVNLIGMVLCLIGLVLISQKA